MKNIKKYFNSMIFVSSMFLSAVYVSLVAIIFLPFSFGVRYRFLNYYSRFNLWMLKVFCNISYEVEGTENIPAGETCIILSKHQSALETMIVQRVFPPLTFVVKKELLKLPFFGWGLASMDPIAIDRKAGRRAIVEIVKQGKDRLAKGIWIVIFPEGTRSRPGSKQRYKKGGSILAEKSGHRVIPVAHTCGEYWPKGFFARQSGKMRMVIGPPIETRGKTADEINRESERWIETKMQEISTIADYPSPDEPARDDPIG
ncbi:MAG: lysophospholipid acyltransferase family protein [Gammaproteobacteria bacterium]